MDQEEPVIGREIKGPWPDEMHDQKHQRMFNNLVELLSDLENGEEDIPRLDNGTPMWGQMSIEFLIQWSVMSARKPMHEHKEVKDENNVRPG